MLIPSIDLMGGKAVQLKQGKTKILEHDDPLSLAEKFNRVGEVAVIDLDAAMGKGDNEEFLPKLFQIASCRVGGGIRTVEKARNLIKMGAGKIIIGTSAFENGDINREFLDSLKREILKEKIIIAVDVKGREVQTHGWTKGAGLNLEQALNGLGKYGNEFLVTCIDREGTMTGPDMELFRQACQLAPGKITAAGGISKPGEISSLSKMEANIQLGMALYTGKISLEEAFFATLDWEKGLIPTITQDQVGQVLMLAYSSRESLAHTLKTARMCYYSRSRKKLWTKGETSGNFQDLVSLRSDCDGDTLLATVEQTGSACHRDNYSCFGPRAFSVEYLEKVIQNRLTDPPPGSYTASLDAEKAREKIIEESGEVISAQSRENLTWEAADLIYHLLVLLAREEITWKDVQKELARRHKP